VIRSSLAAAVQQVEALQARARQQLPTMAARAADHGDELAARSPAGGESETTTTMTTTTAMVTARTTQTIGILHQAGTTGHRLLPQPVPGSTVAMEQCLVEAVGRIVAACTVAVADGVLLLVPLFLDLHSRNLDTCDTRSNRSNRSNHGNSTDNARVLRRQH